MYAFIDLDNLLKILETMHLLLEDPPTIYVGDDAEEHLNYGGTD